MRVSPYERYGEYRPETDASLRVHGFNATEIITGLADLYYGDWRLWRLIADRNKIADVRKIVVGTQLLIPLKPAERGRYVAL
ncbi:MAG: hypothetical protein AUG51_07360 [Acidobacteria bacterium 13_1_20CM_3_53_8]|nr:MAG: hypothetical protein AUG51_07360 [Acidobacteria bacterium 13_1_20CM_3_53_8]